MEGWDKKDLKSEMSEWKEKLNFGCEEGRKEEKGEILSSILLSA